MKIVILFEAIALSTIILSACGSTEPVAVASGSSVIEAAAEDVSIEQVQPYATEDEDTKSSTGLTEESAVDTSVSSVTENAPEGDSEEQQTNDMASADNSNGSSESEVDTASFVEKIPQDDPVRQAYLEQQNNTEDDSIESTTEPNSAYVNDVTELSVIYPDNDAINKYLNAYNAVNDVAITSEDIRTYYSHGKYYDYAISLNGSNTTISNLEEIVRIHFLRASQNEYKEELIRYLKAFDATLDDRAIDNIWNQLSEAKSQEKVFFNDITIFQTSSPFRHKGDDVDFSSITIEGPSNQQ